MDVVGLLLDVGPSMGQEDASGTSSLDRSKNILSLFIQRKIFNQSGDRVCLFSYGSTGTANELASDGAYEHISMERDLRAADWELCRHVQTQMEATNHRVDFLDALIVVSTYLMNEINSINDKKIRKKMDEGRRIIMVFSNFDNPVRLDSDELKSIMQGFKENQLEIHFVGLTGLSEDGGPGDNQPSTSTGVHHQPPSGGPSKPKTENQLQSESIIKEIVEELEGCAYDFREALSAVSVFEGKKKNSMAWSPDLVIGSNLRIPISGYKWVTREALPSFKRCSARNPEELIERKYDTFLPDDTNTEVDKEDIIKGYRYGTDLVPFTDDDMANMKYKCDVREFSVLGFTSAENVQRHYFAGKDTMIILARKNIQDAAVALSALCQALQTTNSVAIVRKVYSARSSPTIGALLPVEERGQKCLCFIELPFMEDMRELEFPSLCTEERGDNSSKQAPTNSQLQAVDELIDSMNMSVKREEREPFEPTNIPNPTLQRLYQVLAARASDETCRLPEISAVIAASINSGAFSDRRTELAQENILSLYKLEKDEKRAKGAGGDNVYKDSNVADNAANSDTKDSGDGTAKLRDLNVDIPTEVRSVDPVRDFQLMVKNPTLVLTAHKSMEDRIQQLVQDSVGSSLYDKALECLKVLRSQVITENDVELVKMYNEFLVSMKNRLTSKGPIDFWKLLVEVKISLIDNSEASNSTISTADKEAYLAAVEEKTEEQPIAMEDEDDLLDGM